MPANADDQRQRQHQRGHARRRAPRRLNQAVGGERAFDRPQPLQHRPHRAAPAPSDSSGAEQQRDDDREREADVEDRTRGCATRQQRHATTARRGRRRESRAAGSRRPRAPDICPSAAPAPDRPARRCARESPPRRCWSRCRAPARARAARARRDLVGVLRDAVDVGDERADRRRDAAGDQQAERDAGERPDQPGDRALAEEQPSDLPRAWRRAHAECRFPNAAA